MSLPSNPRHRSNRTKIRIEVTVSTLSSFNEAVTIVNGRIAAMVNALRDYESTACELDRTIRAEHE